VLEQLRVKARNLRVAILKIPGVAAVTVMSLIWIPVPGNPELAPGRYGAQQPQFDEIPDISSVTVLHPCSFFLVWPGLMGAVFSRKLAREDLSLLNDLLDRI
jgi:hypothetical protein